MPILMRNIFIHISTYWIFTIVMLIKIVLKYLGYLSRNYYSGKYSITSPKGLYALKINKNEKVDYQIF